MKLPILGVVAVTVIAFGSPAEAKGPSELMIMGAGLDRPIVVDPNDDAYVLSRIMDASAFFDAALSSRGPDDRAALRSATSPLRPDHGPRLRLTWSVEWSHTQHLVQDLYLYASGGPLLYTPAGQRLFDQTTPGGWYRAAPRLVDLLQSVGVPSRARLLAAASAQMRPMGSGAIPRW